MLPFTQSYGWLHNVALDINYYAINGKDAPINASDYVEISSETELYVEYILNKLSRGNVRFTLMIYTYASISAFKSMNIKLY